MKFRLEQLAYFVQAVEKGSLNKAAKALYISQPALTKQLALLENQLGCQLLYRKKTGIELTEAGRYLYERASVILAQVDETIDGIDRFRGIRSLRIGSLPSVAHTILPELLAAGNSEENKSVTLVVKDTSAQLAELLELDMLDIAFVQEEDVAGPFCIWPVFQEPYLAVIPAQHPLAAEEAIDFEAFCRELLLIHRDPCDIRKDFRRHCRYWNLQPQHITELDFNDSLVAFAAKGYGLSMVPQMVADALHDSLLAVRPFQSPFTRTIYLISRPESEQEARRLYEDAVALPNLPHSAG